MTKTILITGANTGIGRACAEQLAEPGVRLILACRSRERTLPAMEEVARRGATAEFLKLDLGDLEGATKVAQAFARDNASLDVLINNAGLAGSRGLTKDGYELAFGTNHLGHFAFTLPLLPLLEASKGCIVNVSSGNHYRASDLDFEAFRTSTKSRTGLPEYSASKLANVLFTAELRRRYPSISCSSMHPGRIASDVWRSVPGFLRPILRLVLPMDSVETGGAALVNAMRATESASGDAVPLYFHKREARAANPAALREDLAAKLWQYSVDAIARVPSASEVSHGATA